MARTFTKLVREIMPACKAGLLSRRKSTSACRLQLSIVKIYLKIVSNTLSKKPELSDNAVYKDMRYEGYDLSHVAIIIDVLTDNRNRTAEEIHSLL